MLSAWIFSNDSLSAKGCSGGHCVSVVYVHCGTEHGRPAMVEDPPEDAVVVVVGADTHSRDIIFKSSVVINKLDKAISRTSCIHKNDNYLKWREISILYLPPPWKSSLPKETGWSWQHCLQST